MPKGPTKGLVLLQVRCFFLSLFLFALFLCNAQVFTCINTDSGHGQAGKKHRINMLLTYFFETCKISS